MGGRGGWEGGGDTLEAENATTAHRQSTPLQAFAAGVAHAHTHSKPQRPTHLHLHNFPADCLKLELEVVPGGQGIPGGTRGGCRRAGCPGTDHKLGEAAGVGSKKEKALAGAQPYQAHQPYGKGASKAALGSGARENCVNVQPARPLKPRKQPHLPSPPLHPPSAPIHL